MVCVGIDVAKDKKKIGLIIQSGIDFLQKKKEVPL